MTVRQRQPLVLSWMRRQPHGSLSKWSMQNPLSAHASSRLRRSFASA